MRTFTRTIKTALLLFSVLSLIAVRAGAADTNLDNRITVEQPLDNVIRAMHTYYFSTNYHGSAYAVYSTNAVPGVSYSFGIADCAFSSRIPLLYGKMTATRVTDASTRLELICQLPVAQDSITMASFARAISKTLESVAKIARNKP